MLAQVREQVLASSGSRRDLLDEFRDQLGLDLRVVPTQGVDHMLHVVVGRAVLVIGHVMYPQGRARPEPELL